MKSLVSPVRVWEAPPKFMKKLAKKIIAAGLGYQVRRLRAKNDFKIVAVAGSVGKTSTKLAIARVLGARYKIQYQDGNYNDLVSVPLIFFGQELPSLFNPLAWLTIFWRNARIIKQAYPYEVVVVELGTDGPGQLKDFRAYLKADVGVLTGIAPEHMQFFDDMEAVAKEELTLADLSQRLIVNMDLCPAEYLEGFSKPFKSYGLSRSADVRLSDLEFEGLSSSFEVAYQDKILLKVEHEAVSEPQLYSVTAAVTVAIELGLSPAEIKRGLDAIKPVNGRMRLLPGISDSLIIDDTYNASPQATRAALATLYRMNAPQKIAILGNMNELGEYSKGAHEEIGQQCDPSQLDKVVTIGPDANQYLAAAAEAKGCKVNRFTDPLAAGEYLREAIKKGALILAKGSQNGVFAEETVKLLLADRADRKKLVRQSDYWLKQKSRLLNHSLS